MIYKLISLSLSVMMFAAGSAFAQVQCAAGNCAYAGIQQNTPFAQDYGKAVYDVSRECDALASSMSKQSIRQAGDNRVLQICFASSANITVSSKKFGDFAPLLSAAAAAAFDSLSFGGLYRSFDPGKIEIGSLLYIGLLRLFSDGCITSAV